ncbi:Mu-like prophage major head subunit gpT family protein [Limnohabitans sp.]|uniref:Mu-like prophage major head subunit gpT family protein n=1 Tax=Limnohabitans sp. TaxID=1907725 RepID=UPI00286FAB42|nr:Mu-like prophage major head subunit gpT family protein [Limnohabitans sp.]
MKKLLSSMAAIVIALAAFSATAAVLAHDVAVSLLIGLPSLGITVNRSNMDDLFRGWNMIFNQSRNAALPSLWSNVAMLSPSTGSEEKYPWLGDMPGFREWVGERVVNRLRLHGYTIPNKDFELTVEVKRNDVQDDKVGIYSPMFSMLGEEARRHPDKLVYSLLAQADSTLCFDGQYFCDTDHPYLDANGNTQVQSNWGGGTGSRWFLLETSRTIKPLIFQKRQDYNLVRMDSETDDNTFSRKTFVYGSDARVGVGFGLWQQCYGSRQSLSYDNYVAARAAMQTVKKDGGDPLGINPDLLVVGPSNERAALEAVSVQRLANGADNPYKDTAKVLMVPWLG